MSHPAMFQVGGRRLLKVSKAEMHQDKDLFTCEVQKESAELLRDGYDPLRLLVELSARRLEIAEQVALLKWDSGAAVDDLVREAQVIDDAVRIGASRGLDEVTVINFFRAQIEANKIVQYSLLAEWRRVGKAPVHSPTSVSPTVRQQLDQVQAEMLDALSATVNIRASATCSVRVAKAVGEYLKTCVDRDPSLHEIALDRALAGLCM